jgi:hypothetical protein
MCDVPDCKRVGFAKIYMGKTLLVRLCAYDAYKFCVSVYDFPGAKHVKDMAKKEIDDLEVNEMP